MRSKQNVTWQSLIDQIGNHSLSSSTWNSDQKMLITIFRELDTLGIDPTLLSDANISNLRTLIRPLRIALDKNDHYAIRQYLSDAANLTNSELRLKVHTTNPEIIEVDIEEGPSKDLVFILRLSKEQFERVKKSTKLFYKFPIKK